MGTGVVVEDRAGLDGPAFDRLSVELAGLGTMSRTLAWFASKAPPMVPDGMVPQDEFSFDIVVPFPPGLYLSFDST
jgi:hypothetical protein